MCRAASFQLKHVWRNLAVLHILGHDGPLCMSYLLLHSWEAQQRYDAFTGALDQASPGDGRWTILWTPVQCPVGVGRAASPFFYSFQGSNPWYLKLQIANTRRASQPALAPPSPCVQGTVQASEVGERWLSSAKPRAEPSASHSEAEQPWRPCAGWDGVRAPALLRRRVPVRAASIMGPRGWEVMRRSTDNYFITRGGVYKCAP